MENCDELSSTYSLSPMESEAAEEVSVSPSELYYIYDDLSGNAHVDMPTLSNSYDEVIQVQSTVKNCKQSRLHDETYEELKTKRDKMARLKSCYCGWYRDRPLWAKVVFILFFLAFFTINTDLLLEYTITIKQIKECLRDRQKNSTSCW
ncbi:hypothetical protein J6590_074892 [Homalodisca vitripennis]|nr:hypothetical protein J6590_074892 [Homalodisca vitripennis]